MKYATVDGPSFVEILEQVERTSKKAPKDALLAQLSEQGKRMVKHALDPDITYGITVDEDDWATRTLAPTKNDLLFWNSLEQLTDLLRDRSLTGNAAADAVERHLLMAPSHLSLKWACRLLNKNLRAGFDIKTFNRVFGEGSVEKFTVLLAKVYESEDDIAPSPDGARNRNNVWYAEPKLDGNRTILLDGKAYSRNGKLYTACDHVIDEILEFDPDFFKNWVLDGEMMGDLGFDQSSGALRRISQDGRQQATFTYWAFDLIERQYEWEKRHTKIFSHRLNALEKFTHSGGFKHLKMVPFKALRNPTHKQVMDICDEHRANGFEGAMLREYHSQYEWKRSQWLLKVKRFFDADLQIDGFYEGKGKHKGRLGGIYVVGEIDGREIKSECGSGFDDQLREEIWANQKEWWGATVQVQYQEITPKNSLRFPVFIMRRKDKE